MKFVQMVRSSFAFAAAVDKDEGMVTSLEPPVDAFATPPLHSKTESNTRGEGCWDAKHLLTFSRCCIPEMKDANKLDSTAMYCGNYLSISFSKDEAQE